MSITTISPAETSHESPPAVLYLRHNGREKTNAYAASLLRQLLRPFGKNPGYLEADVTPHSIELDARVKEKRSSNLEKAFCLGRTALSFKDISEVAVVDLQRADKAMGSPHKLMSEIDACSAPLVILAESDNPVLAAQAAPRAVKRMVLAVVKAPIICVGLETVDRLNEPGAFDSKVSWQNLLAETPSPVSAYPAETV